MLQINHRESHDVDIFLTDAQLLGLLDPRMHDFKFEVKPSDYTGDGRGFLKLAFEDIGEIDFIVAQPMTEAPTTLTIIEGIETQLETVAEIIAKKVHYRSANFTPRDIFDIAAAGESHKTEIVEALRTRTGDVDQVLDAIGKRNPEFVKNAISALAIKDEYKRLINTSQARATEILQACVKASGE